MKQLIADMRLPEYRYKQLLDAVFLQGIMRFEDMKLLPKRCAKSWWSSLVKLLWRSRRSIMRNQCKLTRCCLNCRTETVWKRWVCFIKRAGTPFAFHLKAVAASVVSFAQQGLWDYAETWLWMKLPTKSYILCNKDAVSTVSLLWEWESRSLIHKFWSPAWSDRPGTVRAVPATHHHFDYRYRAGYSKIDKRISASQSGLFPPRTYWPSEGNAHANN